MEGGNGSGEAADWLWAEGAWQLCAIVDSAREFMVSVEYVMRLFSTIPGIIFPISPSSILQACTEMSS